MEPKELQSRLTQLSLGETVLLSEKEFQELFHVLPTPSRLQFTACFAIRTASRTMMPSAMATAVETALSRR